MEKQFKPVPDVECLKYHGTPEKPDIKIFVSHRIDKDSEIIDNPLYIPVRCGAVYDDRENVDMLGDDTGDNISEKRESFCELTVMYWAWKNVKADYYGLCHYRRYLSFAEEEFKTNTIEYPWGCVSFPCISNDIISKLKLTVEIMIDEIAGADIITAFPVDVSPIKGGCKNNIDYIKKSTGDFRKSDVDILKSVIEEKFPEYIPYFNDYFKGHYAKWYNCFVMKKDIYDDFCEWLFSILFEVEKRIDFSKCSQQQLRQLGFFGEHLFGIYINKLKKDNKKIIIKYKQIAFFKNSDRNISLHCAFDENNIPVVVMSSYWYVPYLGVFLQSLRNSSRKEYNYDVIIFHNGIDERQRNIITEQFSSENISVRFYIPAGTIGANLDKFYVASPSYAKEAYYRVLTPWILEEYNKIIIMDIDIIINGDLSELYEKDMGNNIAMGVKDILWQGMIADNFLNMADYLKNVFHIKNPYNYINTGVVVLNLEKMRELYSIDKIITLCKKNKFRYQEQDVLNLLIEGKTEFIKPEWNYYVPANPDIYRLIINAPHNYYKEYYDERNNIKIYHYAARPKPWEWSEVLYGEIFWQTAKQTIYYETLLGRMMDTKNGPLYPAVYDLQTRLGIFDTRTSARKCADKLLPEGTKRREFAKKIVPKGSRRWNFCKQVYYFFSPKNRPKKVKKSEENLDEED